MEYKYKVSVVMAVYNVEAYLREAIDSIVEQDIGFENIQLILVDDGSPDGSGAICDEYAAKYPDNILAIHKENGGVSSARNEGLKHVQGQYVNFLDSDDKLAENAIQVVCKFFDANYEKTDLVSFRPEFFDGKKGEHILNIKFKKGERVIDLDREWANTSQLFINSTLIKSECLKGLCFDSRLAYAEDAQLVQKILSNKFTLGVCPDAIYWYRIRSSGEQSAIQAAQGRKGWYSQYLKYFQLHTVEYYMQKVGYVPRFVQNTLMYDLQWRIRQERIPEGVLSELEKQEYRDLFAKALSYIEDDVIFAQKSIYREHQMLALMMKYGKILLYITGKMTYAMVSEMMFGLNFLIP